MVLAVSWLSVTSTAAYKRIGPFWCWFPGRSLYILQHCWSLQWTLLWNWKFFLQPLPPQVFITRGFEALFPCSGSLGCSLCRSPIVFPSLPTGKCETAWTKSSRSTFLPQLPVSAPPTSLDECFFFNSLVVGIPYSSVFWQFWLLFVFKLAIVLLSVVRGSKVHLHMPPSWPEVLKTIFKWKCIRIK